MGVAGHGAGRRIDLRQWFRLPTHVISGRVHQPRPAPQEIELAIAEERRRIARDMHDGIAQDLAFIVSQTLRLAGGVSDPPALVRIAAAAERALSDTRETIYGLSSPAHLTLAAAVTERATRLAERAGLRLELEIADAVETTPEVEHAVLRIVQEALSNAARHAGASTVAVKVSATREKLVVTVADDGCGFDPTRIATATTGGFGLTSMAERARSVGGEVHLESRLDVGTTVELEVPTGLRIEDSGQLAEPIRLGSAIPVSIP
jgi:signal transduction histidine kinase